MHVEWPKLNRTDPSTAFWRGISTWSDRGLENWHVFYISSVHCYVHTNTKAHITRNPTKHDWKKFCKLQRFTNKKTKRWQDLYITRLANYNGWPDDLDFFKKHDGRLSFPRLTASAGSSKKHLWIPEGSSKIWSATYHCRNRLQKVLTISKIILQNCDRL